MPRLKFQTPKYRHHKASGKAVVTFHGRDHYLGKYGLPESIEQYRQLVAEWATAAELPVPINSKEEAPGSDLRVNELVAAYLDYAEKYYRKNGRSTGEAENVEYAVKQLVKLYGRILAREFGPMALKTVRNEMVKEDLCRSVINARVIPDNPRSRSSACSRPSSRPIRSTAE